MVGGKRKKQPLAHEAQDFRAEEIATSKTDRSKTQQLYRGPKAEYRVYQYRRYMVLNLVP